MADEDNQVPEVQEEDAATDQPVVGEEAEEADADAADAADAAEDEEVVV